MHTQLHVHDPKVACSALARAHQIAAPQAPLLEGVRDGVCALSLYFHSAAVFRRPARRDQPQIIVVGDDPLLDRAEAIGPDQWPLCHKLIAWRPQAAIIHASGGEAAHYRLALTAARCVDRVLLVETASAQAGAWRALLTPACPLLMILPSTGAHPRPEMRH